MLRFKHIFSVLLLLAAVGAFIVPPGTGEGMRAVVAGVFMPVSRPTRAVAGWAHERLVGNRPRDDEAADGGPSRPIDALRSENESLRITVASLMNQLDALKQLNADRQMLGEVRPLCEPFPVAGADSGSRRSLILQTAGRGDVREGQPVLYRGGVAGRVEKVGVGAAIVRLITDRNFRLTGGFGRFEKDDTGHVTFHPLTLSRSQPPLLEGTGRGLMLIENVDMKDAKEAQLRPGDWVVLADRDWPIQLQGYKVGQIERIDTRPSAPLFARIEVRPLQNLMQLREVMVMNKE